MINFCIQGTGGGVKSQLLRVNPSTCSELTTLNQLQTETVLVAANNQHLKLTSVWRRLAVVFFPTLRHAGVACLDEPWSILNRLDYSQMVSAGSEESSLPQLDCYTVLHIPYFGRSLA